MRVTVLFFTIVLFLPLFLFPGSATAQILGPSNYYECIIDRLPDATVEWQANLVRRQCRSQFPDYYRRASLTKKSGTLDPTAEKCIEKNVPEKPLRIVKQLVTEACRGLYLSESRSD